VTSDEPGLRDLALGVVGDDADPRTVAVKVFEYVRDTVSYSPYVPCWEIEQYSAMQTVQRGQGNCVQKASLLCAMMRSLGIPARLAYADIINHRLSERTRRMLGTDYLLFHGWTEMWLSGRWVKAASAFDSDLCREQKVPLVEFDGEHDALMPEKDLDGDPYIEYIKLRGHLPFVPLDEMVAAWIDMYGKENMKSWVRATVG